MKLRATICILIMIWGSAVPLRGQNFAIDWFTIDGGGSTSTGGLYSVSGTIGQPDAGKMNGGTFAINGGFWSLLAPVQMPDAPLLSVRLTSTNTVAISWPSPSTGFTLEQNANDVTAADWTPVSVTPIDDGKTKTVIVNPPTGNRFYRLKN
jgi:hypothetical protein